MHPRARHKMVIARVATPLTRDRWRSLAPGNELLLGMLEGDRGGASCPPPYPYPVSWHVSRPLICLGIQVHAFPHLSVSLRLTPSLSIYQDRPPPWTKVETEGLGAQQAWEAWTTRAEDWLLRRAAIPQEAEDPYKGRGAPPAIRMRMPLPIATRQQHGEVHGRAKIWAAQENRYRELARAREEHRTYYGDLLSAAIAAYPP